MFLNRAENDEILVSSATLLSTCLTAIKANYGLTETDRQKLATFSPSCKRGQTFCAKVHLDPYQAEMDVVPFTSAQTDRQTDGRTDRQTDWLT